MQTLTLSELPIVTMTRSDRVLDLCLKQLQSITDSQTNNYTNNKQPDFHQALLDNLFDMGQHQLRHEDITSALAQHWQPHNLSRNKLENNKGPYKLNCLADTAERYLQFMGDHFAVKHNLETQYQAIINTIHPSFLIAASFNHLVEQQQLSHNALNTLLAKQCPLGFAPSDINTTYADNHVHFGGVHGCEVLSRFLFSDINANALQQIKLPRVPEFTLVNNNHYQAHTLISLYRLLFNEFCQLNFESAQKDKNQQDKNQQDSLFNNSQFNKTLNLVLNSKHMAKNDNLVYNFARTGRKPQTPIQSALHAMAECFINDQQHLALVPFASALLQQVNNPKSLKHYYISLGLIHLVNILRSYVVMSGVGLSQFIDFFNSTLRKHKKHQGDNHAINWLLDNNNVASIKTAPIKSTEQLKNLAAKVVNSNPQLQNQSIGCEHLLAHYNFCIHFSRTDSHCVSRTDSHSVSRTDSHSVSLRKNAKYSDTQKQHYIIDQATELHQILSSQNKQSLYISDKQKLSDRPQSKLYLQQTVRGFDVAGNENHHRIEVFAPALRYLREKPIEFNAITGEPQLHRRRYLSIHAGEDYNHLISGLRHIDETVEYCNMGNNDRIGHALALGVMPKQWAKRQQQTFISVEEDLWNIVWLTHHAKRLAAKYQQARHVIHLLEMQLGRLQTKFFKQCFLFDDLWRYWQNRANAKQPQSLQSEQLPNHKYWIQTAFDKAQLQSFEPITRAIDNCKNTKIRIILDDPTGHHKDALEDESRHLCTTELEFYQLLQDDLMMQYDNKGITIEACPSSNISLGRFEHYHQHPIFRWFPPDDNLFERCEFDPYNVRQKREVAVCINTDDPGIFPTNIEQEYRLLKDAAQKHYGCSSQTVYIWLERLRQQALRVFSH